VSGARAEHCALPRLLLGTFWGEREFSAQNISRRERAMGQYLLVWLLSMPMPILVLVWAFGELR
jgi:hypothetical protein